MELKGRLKALADEVPVCGIVSDIGTDHAYVPIYLVQKGVCKKAVASDVRQGPIHTAQKNIQRHNLDKWIGTRIGSGLVPIRDEEIDVVIIAGMGGLLICNILEESMEKAVKAERLILQPMNAVELVREWLYKNGFEITAEVLAEEGDKLYNIISARWTGQSSEKEEIHYYIGEKLAEEKDPLLRRHIEKKLQQLDSILSGMKKSENTGENTASYRKLRERMEEILRKL